MEISLEIGRIIFANVSYVSHGMPISEYFRLSPDGRQILWSRPAFRDFSHRPKRCNFMVDEKSTKA